MPLPTRRRGRGGRPRLPGVHVGVGSRGYKSAHGASVTSVSYGQGALIVYTPTVIVWVGRRVTTWVPLFQDAGVPSVRCLKQPLTSSNAAQPPLSFQILVKACTDCDSVTELEGMVKAARALSSSMPSLD